MIQTFSLADPDISVQKPSGNLTIELVPGNRWGTNLRTILSKAEWDKLRKVCYATAQNQCEICGGKGIRHPVEAHEVWHWDDVKITQRLVRLIALCPSCHDVKHIGRAFAIGHGPRALGHLAKINGWTMRQARDCYDQAMVQWHAKSNIPWKLDLSWLETQGLRVPVQK